MNDFISYPDYDYYDNTKMSIFTIEIEPNIGEIPSIKKRAKEIEIDMNVKELKNVSENLDREYKKKSDENMISLLNRKFIYLTEKIEELKKMRTCKWEYNIKNDLKNNVYEIKDVSENDKTRMMFSYLLREIICDKKIYDEIDGININKRIMEKFGINEMQNYKYCEINEKPLKEILYKSLTYFILNRNIECAKIIYLGINMFSDNKKCDNIYINTLKVINPELYYLRYEIKETYNGEEESVENIYNELEKKIKDKFNNMKSEKFIVMICDNIELYHKNKLNKNKIIDEKLYIYRYTTLFNNIQNVSWVIGTEISERINKKYLKYTNLLSFIKYCVDIKKIFINDDDFPSLIQNSTLNKNNNNNNNKTCWKNPLKINEIKEIKNVEKKQTNMLVMDMQNNKKRIKKSYYDYDSDKEEEKISYEEYFYN